jgi:hypothetical protein
MIDDELKKILEDLIGIPSRNFPGGTEENHENRK